MMHQPLFLSTAMTTLVLALATPPCAAQAVVVDGSKLLDAHEQRHRERAGGKQLKTLHNKGRAEFVLKVGPNPGTPVVGEFEEFFKGDRYYHYSEFPNFGTREEGHDGKVVWELDPATGAVIKRGDDRAQALRIHALPLTASWRDFYTTAQITSKQDVGGHACDVVLMKPKQGKPERWYVNEDGQLLGVDLEMHVGMDQRENVEVRFADYELVEGIQHARKVTVSFGVVSITFHYDTIEPNVDVSDDHFELPKAVVEAIESQPQAAEDDGVKITMVQERHIVSIRTKVALEDIGSMLAVALPEVMRYLTEAGVQPAGAPLTRYHAVDPSGEMDIEAGIPVSRALAGKDRVKASKLPACKVATTWHIGQYHELGKSHARLEQWIADHGFETAGPQWEVYMTDPGLEPNPAKWRTQIFWPLK